MGRAPCCDKLGLKKGPWTPEEDKILVDYIQTNGHGSWRSLPKLAGLLRCGKSCRLRWTNYLRPDIKRGPFTPEEEMSIIQLHGIVGNKWSIIAAQLPGRTDNEIKNYWNTHLKKRLLRMGFNLNTINSITTSAATTRHMTQWETARLEAESRLSRETLLFTTSSAAAATTTTVSADDCQPPPPKPQAADFFLRMWNSEVGDTFRKKSSLLVDEEVVESKSCITASEQQTLPYALEFMMMDESSGSDEMVGTSEEAYRMYLDFATGEELCVFGGQLGGFDSLFSGDQQAEASLDTDLK